MNFQETSTKHSALGWVKLAIHDTLTEARTHLKRFSETPEDASELLAVKDRLDLIHGVLTMIEQHGAAMLTEEMIALIDFIHQQNGEKIEPALEVLLRAVLQLPDYLEHVQSGNSDNPIVILPILNDIRSVRDKDLFSEKLLFLPDLSMHQEDAEVDEIDQAQNEASKLLAKKLRPIYQLALLNVIRDKSIDDSLKRLQKVCETLEERAFSEQVARIWWVVGALIESVMRQQLELGVSIKNLLGKVDGLFRVILIIGERGLSKRQPIDLIKNVLFYIAQPGCDGPKSQAIKTAYRLEEFLPSESTRSEVLDNIAGPNQALLKTVAEAMQSDIEAVKSTLEVYVNGDLANVELLKELPKELNIIADTLAMIGLGSQRQLVQSQVLTIEEIVAGKPPEGEDQLLSMAAELLQIEQALARMQKRKSTVRKEVVSDADLALEYEFERVVFAVVTAALDDILKTKNAILEFTQNFDQPENIGLSAALMGEIRGALEMLGKTRAIAVVDGLLTAFHTFKPSDFNQTKRLDALSQIIVSLECYFEALGEQRSDAESVLDIADSQLKELFEGFDSSQAEQPSKTVALTDISESLITSDTALTGAIDSALPIADLQGEILPDQGNSDEGSNFDSIENVPPEGDADSVQGAPFAPAEPQSEVGKLQDVAVVEDLVVLRPGGDPEILEIYIEEATDECANIVRLQHDWLRHPEDEATAKNLRRAFHTIKGSGRLVGAEKLAGLASDYEQLISRVVDRTVVADALLIGAVGKAAEFLPSLVDELRSPLNGPVEISYLRGLARNFATPGMGPIENTEADSIDGQLTADSVTPLADIEDDHAEQEMVEESSLVITASNNSRLPADSVSGTDADEYLLEADDTNLEDLERTLYEIDALDQKSIRRELTDDSLENSENASRRSSSFAGDVAEAQSNVEDSDKDKDDSGFDLDRTLTEIEVKEFTETFHNMQPGAPKENVVVNISGRQLDPEQTAPTEQESHGGANDEAELLDLEKTLTEFEVREFEETDLESLSSALSKPFLEPEQKEKSTADLDSHLSVVDSSIEDDEDAIIFNFDNATTEPYVEAQSSTEPTSDIDQDSLVAPFADAALPSGGVIGVDSEQSKDESESHLPADSNQQPALSEPFDQELLAIYQREVEQHLMTVDSVLSYAESVQELVPDENIYRALHTIKGASRTADISTVGELASLLEKPLKTALARNLSLDQEVVALYREGQRAVQGMVAELVSTSQLPALPYDLGNRLRALNDDLDLHTADIPNEAVKDAKDFIDTMSLFANAADSAHDSELLTIFVDEANELLELCDEILHQWSGRQLGVTDESERATVLELQRYLHTLKGGARMAELKEISDLSHEMESMLIALIDGRVEKNEELVELLKSSFDLLHSQVGQAQAQLPMADSSQQVQLLRDLRLGGEAPESNGGIESEIGDTQLGDDLLGSDSVADAKRPVQDVVKVRSELLDNLVNSAGEVSIYRARMEQQVAGLGSHLGELGQTIARLKGQLRSLEAETDAQIHFSHRKDSDDRGDFDPLEMDRYTLIQELSRSLSESVNDLSSLQGILGDQVKDSETLLLQQYRVNTDLQDGLIKSRMVKFSALLSRLRRLVRQSSQASGNKAEMVVSGEDNEVDSKVLDRMVAPLEHIIRNALSHGIETPEQRIQKGKPEAGRITIDITRGGSDVVIRVSDDGAGIDVRKVRNRAVELGLMQPEQQITDAELLQYILEPGFSTAERVTQLSGRGVGMDVVDIEIKQLGGTLEIETNSAGTTFIARLPFTLAINQAILVRTGDETYAIPLPNIEGITRIRTQKMVEYYQQEEALIDYADQKFVLHHLSKLVGGNTRFKPVEGNENQAVILSRSGDTRVALHVDEILGNREIVVKTLGKQISQVKGLAGASILADGSVVLILDVGGLIRHPAIQQVNATYNQLPAVKERTKVMVVDDSITMRRVAAKLLERHNYEVITAKDGVDALAQLAEVRPDIMLLDIEMPRMDGFELAANIRGDKLFADIPIIMITSRSGEKHRNRAMEIGVTNYLGKPYQESDLIENIQSALNSAGRRV